jgi:RNA polymerase sigma-70 factor (ECF subfamily)
VSLTRWQSAVSLSWVQTDDPPYRRKCPAARRNELDDLLIAVGARRDGKAFTVLFDHFRPRVQARLVRLGLAPAAAEDLTQDVMETIWRKAHLYDPRQAAAITWVFQIARNRRIDVKRRSREFCLAAELFLPFPIPPKAATIVLTLSSARRACAPPLTACRKSNSRLCGSPSLRGCHTAPSRDG